MTKRKRTIYKITNQAFLLALGIGMVATLGFIFVILAGKPVAKSEGWKLLGIYGVLAILAVIRWLANTSDSNQPD